MSNTRTLFLSSNPDATSLLSVDKEYNRVRERLGSMDTGWSQAIDHWPDVRIDQLPDRLLDYEPAIVHFSGHGLPDGGLRMRDADGQPRSMHPDGLADLIALFSDSVRMVVLNACFSEALAVKLIQHVEVVVGMRTAVSDPAGVLFAPTFYGTLARKCSVAKAFQIARATVAASYPDDADNPQCHSRADIDPAQVFFGDIAAPKPARGVSPTTPGPEPRRWQIGELTQSDKDRLCNLLVHSPHLLQAQTRQSIFDRMRPDIRVQLGSLSTPKATISAAVNTCDRYAGGIAEFIEAVRFYEQGTTLMSQLDAWAESVSESGS